MHLLSEKILGVWSFMFSATVVTAAFAIGLCSCGYFRNSPRLLRFVCHQIQDPMQLMYLFQLIQEDL